MRSMGVLQICRAKSSNVMPSITAKKQKKEKMKSKNKRKKRGKKTEQKEK